MFIYKVQVGISGSAKIWHVTAGNDTNLRKICKEKGITNYVAEVVASVPSYDAHEGDCVQVYPRKQTIEEGAQNE